MLQMGNFSETIPPLCAPGQYRNCDSSGTLLTGKTYRTEHLNVVSKGISPAGRNGMKRIRRLSFVSKPGIQARSVWLMRETVWITIHATSETRSVVKLEAGTH